MTIKVTSTRIVDPEKVKIKLCVFSEAGIGKTVLCSTAPNPIILSAERGLLSLAHKDVPVIIVNNKAEVDEAYQFLIGSNEAKKYETVCLDSVSEIAEVLLEEKKNINPDGRQYWPDLASDISDMIRSFRDNLDFNIVFTAKQARIKDEYTQVTTHKPDMPGKNLTNALPYFFDMLFPMRIGEMEDGSGSYRYIQPQPTIDYEAKDRSGALGWGAVKGERVFLNKERPDLTFIFNKIKKHIIENPDVLKTAENAIQQK